MEAAQCLIATRSTVRVPRQRRRRSSLDGASDGAAARRAARRPAASPARRKAAAKASAAPAPSSRRRSWSTAVWCRWRRRTGTAITTIEGVARRRAAARVQQAFVEHGGAQCGICTPGMVLAAVTLLERNPHPTEADVRDGARRQPVPLHRLHADLRGGAAGLPRTREHRSMRSYSAGVSISACRRRSTRRSRCWREPAARWRPFAGGTDLMVLLEAGKLPAATYLSLWGLRELRGIEVLDDGGRHRRADDLHRGPGESTLLSRSSRCSAAPRGRPAASPPRTAARSAATSPTRRRPPTRRRRCSSTTPSSSSPRSRGDAPRPVQHVPHGLQADGPRAGRADRQRAPAASGARGRASTTARSARAARRRSRRSASPVRVDVQTGS